MRVIKTLQYTKNIEVICRILDAPGISVMSGYAVDGEHVRDLSDDECMEIEKDQSHLHLLWSDEQ